MKLSDAAVLCDSNSRAFVEVYKLYNYKDEDELKAYVDFVIHEPVEWMRGFPASWKSVGLFSKPRAAFHRLLKTPAVLEELSEKYCEHVHGIIWNAFKTNMNSILEKRNGAAQLLLVEESGSIGGKAKPSAAAAMVAGTEESTHDDERSDILTADSFEEEDILPPVPHVPVTPWSQVKKEFEQNSVRYDTQTNYKRKYEVLFEVTQTLLASGRVADENVRLRTALSTLLSEFSRA